MEKLKNFFLGFSLVMLPVTVFVFIDPLLGGAIIVAEAIWLLYEPYIKKHIDKFMN